MYDEKILELDFFKELKIKTPSLNMLDILDTLTGLINRRYIESYVDYLVANYIPFSMQMIDMDNFKQVNDNYGHHIGDEVLKEFSRRITNIYKNNKEALIGRFGGDEFIVILPYIYKYNDVKKNIADNYFKGSNPLRTKYNINGLEIYITGTIGSASFPLDASDYDKLFLTADKALYRGKLKGRNCYIIYVESKHKNIDISKNIKTPLNDLFFDTIRTIENYNTVEDRVIALNSFLIDRLKIGKFLYFKDNETLGKNIDVLLNSDGYFMAESALSVKKNYKEFYNYLVNNGIVTFLLFKLQHNGKDYGYIMLTEDKISRIWQDEDICLMILISKLLIID